MLWRKLEKIYLTLQMMKYLQMDVKNLVRANWA